jgi:glycogen operon protein
MNQFIAYRLNGSQAAIKSDCEDNDFYIIFNASTRDITTTLCPTPKGKKWFRVIDTSWDSPGDILEPGKQKLLENQQKYVVLSRTGVVLISGIV